MKEKIKVHCPICDKEVCINSSREGDFIRPHKVEPGFPWCEGSNKPVVVAKPNEEPKRKGLSHAYCLNCRRKVAFLPTQIQAMGNHRYQLGGNCFECGKGVSLIHYEKNDKPVCDLCNIPNALHLYCDRCGIVVGPGHLETTFFIIESGFWKGSRVCGQCRGDIAMGRL